MKNSWFKFLVLLVFISSCDESSSSLDFKIKPLISASKLMLLQQKGTDVVFIDVRQKADFQMEHIVGARNVWRPQIQDTSNFDYGGMMATKKQMEKLLSKLGIKSGDYLVLYDNNGQVDAARLWWILHFYGYENMSLLDGGLYDWKQQNGETRIGKKNKNKKTKFKFKNNVNKELFSDKSNIDTSLGFKGLLVDCRSTNEYNGSVQKKGAFRAGHIPNAIHADYHGCINMNIESKNYCKLKSKKKLLEMYTAKGITENDTIVLYCHSGVRSAHSTFVLTQILGFKNVKNYDGSWIEWSYFKELPIEN